MKENLLIDKSIAFASRIIKLHQYLIKTKKETIVENIVCWISPNLHIKLKQIQGRGKYSDVIWSDFFVWYEAIENAQGQFKEQARWVSCIKMGMKNNPENAIYCKNCWHA